MTGKITGIVTNLIEIFFLERGSSISKVGEKRKKVILSCFINDRFILLAQSDRKSFRFTLGDEE